MQELIAIQNQPALVEVNFEELKKHLSSELKKYDVVVTQDTVKDAKALATELNKTKAEIAKRKKEEYDRATAGANQFKDNMKELETMCEDGRKSLLSQVQKFEDETRALAQSLLKAERDHLREELSIDPEFHKAEFDDLINLSAVTGKGNLTAKAKGALESRVKKERSLQDQTRMRLLELENQSYKAGLSAPLNRGHVEHFLFAEDEEYRQKLEALMQSELQREEVAQQRMRDQMERESREKERQEQARREREERTKAAQAQTEAPKQAGLGRENQEGPAEVPRSVEELEAEKPKSGRVPVTVSCTFNISVAPSTTDSAIEAELRRVLERAGIKTLDTVNVVRQQEVA